MLIYVAIEILCFTVVVKLRSTSGSDTTACWAFGAVAGSAICDMAGPGPAGFLAGSADVSRRFRGRFRAVPWAAPGGSGRFLPVYVDAVLQFKVWIPHPLVDNWGSRISF